MKRMVMALVLVMVLSSTLAFAEVKSCDELKAEIEAKLKAKGVEGYTLEIIPSDQVKDQKIIGTCECGSKKISYSRNKVK